MKHYFPTLKVLALALPFALLAGVLSAAPANPPSSNLSRPINIGAEDQVKNGILMIKGGLSIFGGTASTNKVHVDASGRLGVGVTAAELTAEPTTTALIAKGKIKTSLTDGQVCANAITGELIICGTLSRATFTSNADFIVPAGITTMQIELHAPLYGYAAFQSKFTTITTDCTEYDISNLQSFLRKITPVAYASNNCFEIVTNPVSTPYRLMLYGGMAKTARYTITVTPGHTYEIRIDNQGAGGDEANKVLIYY